MINEGVYYFASAIRILKCQITRDARQKNLIYKYTNLRNYNIKF
ncbi:MAG: hypothetical protein H6Q17_518 [Bacteroidetes bacterium]|nr:hypothetical protein [Bacteroidota bacterium]